MTARQGEGMGDGIETSAAESNEDRRRAPRVEVDLEVDCCHEGTFLFAYITDVSSMGVFVRANNPHPPGTRLKVSFTPPGGGKPLLLEGEVIWISPYRPDAPQELNAGMGIRFVEVDETQRQRLAAVVGKALQPE